MPDPDEMTWGLQDLSDESAGRTEDTKMHKKRIGQKVKMGLKWLNPTAAEIHSILTMFNPEYVELKYYDPLYCASENSVRAPTEFYVGDRSSPLKRWDSKEKRFQELSFDIIER